MEKSSEGRFELTAGCSVLFLDSHCGWQLLRRTEACTRRVNRSRALKTLLTAGPPTVAIQFLIGRISEIQLLWPRFRELARRFDSKLSWSRVSGAEQASLTEP